MSTPLSITVSTLIPFKYFISGANVIRVRMRRDEVVELLNFVTLQRFEHDFAFAGIACVDQNGLTTGRQNQSRITFDRANIEHNDLQFARRFWRLCTPPRADPHLTNANVPPPSNSTSTAITHPHPRVERFI